jgi:predicted dehydrogenase
MSAKQKSSIPLIAGVVGCGGISQVIHLPILKKHPDIKLQTLCDVDTSKAAIVADRFNIPKVYEDIAEMLNQEQLDMVFILTPNNMHLPMSLLALDHDVHVFIEKPAARNATEAERIKKHADISEKTVMVGMQNRFRPDVIALHRFINGNELGKPFFIKAGWLHAQYQAVKQAWLFNQSVSGGGVVMDLGVQLIDMVWWLLGRPKPSCVKSFSYKINKELKVEDFCVACITFGQDISFSVEISWDFPISQDIFYLEIIGEKGIGTMNPVKLQKLMHGQIMNIIPNLQETKIGHFKMGYQNELNHWIDFLTGRVDRLESNIDDAIEVLKIVDGLYKSIEEKKEIKL